jgi:hypothetical protein
MLLLKGKGDDQRYSRIAGCDHLPSMGARTRLTLLGAGLIPIPFVFVGISLAGYFWPGNSYEVIGPPTDWLGGFIGLAIGVVVAFLVMVTALRSRSHHEHRSR